MSVALTLLLQDSAPDLLEAQLAFHLNAGVELVVVSDQGAGDATREVLDAFASEWNVSRAPGSDHTTLARVAVEEGAVEWVIPAEEGEFLWPRGESINDVLAVIPKRYDVVQGLVRTFVGDPVDGQFFAEHLVTRTSLLGSEGSVAGDFHRLLRPVYRAHGELVIDDEDWMDGGRRIPLRAWYPIEAFRFPRGDAPEADETSGGSHVVDTRLRDALRTLRDGNAAGMSFAGPSDTSRGLTLPVPTIVDDASYAVECAAVGEVDLVRLDRQIRELEERIAALEAPFWPSVRRSLRRLARRPS